MRSVATAVACALLAIAPEALGSPLELYSFGGRSPALAGAGQADAAGYDSAYLNPAGLADLPRKRLSLGYLYGDIALEMDGADTGTERPAGMTFGAALPLPLGGALAGKVGLAVGIYTPTGTLTRVRVPMPGQPVFSLLETRSQTIGVLVAAGVRPHRRLSVGFGVLALAALRGYIFVDVDGAGRFSSDSEQKLVTNYAPIGGAIYDPRDDLRLGLTVRAPSRSSYDIQVTNDLASELPLTLPTLRIAGTAQYDPLAVDAEAIWHARPRLRVFGLLSYQRWSAFPVPTENPILTAPPQEDPGFHDTVRPKIGVELTRPQLGGELALRGGYAFIWSPAPKMKTRQSLLDNHRHLFGVGAGLAWPTSSIPLHLDAWIQLHWLMPRKHEKDPDAFGPDEPLPFESISTRGHIIVGGVSAGVDL